MLDNNTSIYYNPLQIIPQSININVINQTLIRKYRIFFILANIIGKISLFIE